MNESTNSIAESIIKFGKEPQQVTCPHCQENVSTRVEDDPSACNHSCSIFCFNVILIMHACFGCGEPCTSTGRCSGCCGVTKKHYCSNCKRYLGDNSADSDEE